MQRIRSGGADGSIVYGEQTITTIDGEWKDGIWTDNDPVDYWGDSPIATNAIIKNTGVQTVDYAGTATDTKIEGGKQIVKAYGHIKNTEINQQGHSTIEFGAYSTGNLTVNNGTLTMEGGDTHSWTGVLGKGSYTQNVNLAGENSDLILKYNPDTDGSTITIDNLVNKGEVYFNQKTNPTKNQYNQLNIENLTGNGTFNMNTNVTANKGDFLNVTEHVDGNFNVKVADSGQELSNDSSEKKYHLIHAKDSVTDSFALHKGSVDIGAYKYVLLQDKNNADDWYLTLHKTGENPDTSAPAENAFMIANVTPTIWKAELSSLRTRLGELRYQNKPTTSVWGKYISNEHKIDNDQVAYKQKMNGLIVGADKEVSLNNSQLFLGGLFSYTQSDLEARNGDGKVDSYGVGLYSTWLHNSGYYVDTVLKANRFKTENNAHFNDKKTSARSNSNGVGLSVEVGKHIKKQDYFIEPYAQFSAFYGQANKYQFDNEMKVKSKASRSLTGELGMTVGKNFVTANNTEIKPYVRLAVNHEFYEDSDVIINRTERFSNNMAGTVGKIGVGMDVRFAKSWYVYGELNYANGKKQEMPYDGHLGLRYTF